MGTRIRTSCGGEWGDRKGFGLLLLVRLGMGVEITSLRLDTGKYELGLIDSVSRYHHYVKHKCMIDFAVITVVVVAKSTAGKVFYR